MPRPAPLLQIGIGELDIAACGWLINDRLVAAGRSMDDAVLREAECCGNDQPLVTMIQALALGLRYRSPMALAAMQAASVQRQPWRDQPPD